MERRSTKHGPRTDDQLAHEDEPLERGTPQRPHVEEWREPEPTGDIPAAGRPEAVGGDIELRSELARTLPRDIFPTDRDGVLARLRDADASAELVERVAGLPADRRFGSGHDVMEALGIQAPEHRQR